jgi:hypothetical protein
MITENTTKLFEIPENYKLNIEPYFEYAKYIAYQRSSQKEKYKTSNPMSDNYEVVGVLGEIVYQIQTNEMFDYRLLVNGDDGDDFNFGVNVKSSEEHKAKHLIEYLDKKIPKIYVFVKINLEKKYGYIYGWIFGFEFERDHKIIDFGYGKRKSIVLEKLKPYYTYLPIINKANDDLKRVRFIIDKYLEIPNKKFIDINKKL